NNTFHYDEEIHAVYGTYGYQWEKLSFSSGLRAEQAFTKSTLVDSDSTFTNNYFALYPSTYLTYKLKKAGELQLSYSRRVNRPGMRQLNPFPSYSDNLNLRRGNPFLLPEFVNAYEFTYSLRKKQSTFMASVYMQDVNQVIRNYKTIDTAGVSTTSFQNLAGVSNIGLEAVVNYTINSWWTVNVSMNGYRVQSDGTNLESDLSVTAYSWSARGMSTMKFNNGLQVQLTGFYRAPENNLQGQMSDMYFADIAVKTAILKGKGTLTVNLRDVFDTRQFSFYSFGPGFEQNSMRKRESRNLFVTFAYRFGKLEAGKERRERGAAGGEGFDGGGMEID
ncbi:MAG: hypothetical protein RL226_975, partial [Bacteroidota bacterium]